MPLTVPPCQPARIMIVADDGGGDFTGMSHGGTWLYLRNTSVHACALPALPLVRLLDRRGRPLPALRRPPVGMHPGPVMPPVTVAAGHRVRLSLRWVSGAVFDRSRCLTATRVAVTIGSGRATARVAARLCGPAGAAAPFDQTVLAPIEEYPAE